MKYSDDVIILPSEDKMLIKSNKATGLNLEGIKYKPAYYKNHNYFYLPWTIDTCHRIAKIGLNVRGGIYYHYPWPGKFTPREHQIVTANFFANNPRCFCFNDIGTGKTLSSLWAADYLISQRQIRRVLIVCTVSTMKRVWEDTLFHHFPHRSAVVLYGARPRRIERYLTDCDFYIINHDGLKVMGTELERRTDIDLIIADEGAKFRNKNTNLWKAMYAFAHERTGRWLWWLTGSPTPNAPTDAWAQAKIVNPCTVPRYFTRFREETMFRVNQFLWKPRKNWQDMVYSSLKPSIRYDRDDCLDLPECQTVDHNIKMTEEQEKYYTELKKKFFIELNNTTVTAVNEMVKLNKLIQVSSGAVYDDDKTVQCFDVKHKLNELADIMEEVGNKLIVYVPYRHTLQVLEPWLRSTKTVFSKSYDVIHGGIGEKRRSKIFDEFQHGNLKMIIAQPAAMAHGLTLTASNTIVWWSPIDSYEIYEQANGRIVRESQARKQYIKRLICSDIESKIYQRLANKESMQGLLLNMIADR